MNDGLLTITELVFLLYDRLAISGLSFLDNCRPVAISVAIFVRLTNRYAGAHWTDPYSDIVSECGSRNSSDHHCGE
jgi:hypothetical protein